MQILTAHITWRTIPTSEYLASSVSIDVPGLGIVEVQDFISNELRNKIEAEAIFALNQKLGILSEKKDDKISEPEIQ